MGWGEGSVYFSTEPGTTPDEYVDEICMTQEHTIMGWIYVFKGVKTGVPFSACTMRPMSPSITRLWKSRNSRSRTVGCMLKCPVS